jgi:hypothetical protein
MIHLRNDNIDVVDECGSSWSRRKLIYTTTDSLDSATIPVTISYPNHTISIRHLRRPFRPRLRAVQWYLANTCLT